MANRSNTASPGDPALWDWNPQIAALVGAPKDFIPMPAELQMLDFHLPPLSAVDVKTLESKGAEGQRALSELVLERHRTVWLARQDPLRHGFELPHWKDFKHLVRNRIETFVPGGNNSAKSWLLGKLIVEVLTRRFTWPEMPGSGIKVLALAQDDTASKMFQQPAVYAHLPVQLREYNQGPTKKRRWDMKINYTDTGGFTEGVFSLPAPIRSQCWFMTVAQWLDNPRKFEGPAYHLVVVDEGCPRGLWETLKVRARKVGGRLVYSLTCVDGYDEVMGDALEGARLMKALPMQHDWLTGVRAT